MSDILRKYLDPIAVGIPDDVIIFSESLPEHIPHVRSIQEVMRQHQLYAKVEKCEFHKDQITFVGYLVLGPLVSAPKHCAYSVLCQSISIKSSHVRRGYSYVCY